jgi:hypothetical protein
MATGRAFEAARGRRGLDAETVTAESVFKQSHLEGMAKTVMKTEVRLYELHSDGTMESLFDTDISHYGVCPSVNDVICEPALGAHAQRMLRVVRRYFINSFANPGWTVLLEPLEDPSEATAVFEEYTASTKFWHEVAEQEQREKAENIRTAIASLATRPNLPKRPKLPKPPKPKVQNQRPKR